MGVRGGRVWYSLIIKHLAHYSLTLNCSLIHRNEFHLIDILRFNIIVLYPPGFSLSMFSITGHRFFFSKTLQLSNFRVVLGLFFILLKYLSIFFFLLFFEKYI